MHNGTSVTQFIIEEQRGLSTASGEFTSLLNDIVTACKVISNEVNRGNLIGILGAAESENIQGETQKELDIITNDILLRPMSGQVIWQRWLLKRWMISTPSQNNIQR